MASQLLAITIVNCLFSGLPQNWRKEDGKQGKLKCYEACSSYQDQSFSWKKLLELLLAFGQFPRVLKKLVLPVSASSLITLMEEKISGGPFSLTRFCLLQGFLPTSPGGGLGGAWGRSPGHGLGKLCSSWPHFPGLQKEMCSKDGPRGHSHLKHPVSVPYLEATEKQKGNPFILSIP